jgi:hypothetical protein
MSCRASLGVFLGAVETSIRDVRQSARQARWWPEALTLIRRYVISASVLDASKESNVRIVSYYGPVA